MRNRLVFCAKILFAAFVFWMLSHNSQLKMSLFTSLFLNPIATFGTILLCYFTVILHAWRWYRLNIVQGINLSFSKTLMPTYIGMAFNTVLPGSVGGDFVRSYYILKQFPHQKSRAILAILADRIIGLIAVFGIACLISPYYLELFRHNTILFFLLVVCMSVCLGSLLVGVLGFWLLSDKTTLYRQIVVKSQHSKPIRMLRSLLEAIHVYRNAKFVILETLLISMLTQATLLVLVMIISKIMGLALLSPFDYMLALVIGQVVNLVPLTPGGVGLGEAAFANVILIIHPGVTAAYATVFFALRLLNTVAVLPGVLVGIFGYHLLDKSHLKVYEKSPS